MPLALCCHLFLRFFHRWLGLCCHHLSLFRVGDLGLFLLLLLMRRFALCIVQLVSLIQWRHQVALTGAKWRHCFVQIQHERLLKFFQRHQSCFDKAQITLLVSFLLNKEREFERFLFDQFGLIVQCVVLVSLGWLVGQIKPSDGQIGSYDLLNQSQNRLMLVHCFLHRQSKPQLCHAPQSSCLRGIP